MIPKKKVIERLEGQTSGICVQSVLVKWYWGCLTILLDLRKEEVPLRFLPRNGEPIWVSLLALWMWNKLLTPSLQKAWAWSWKKWTLRQWWQEQFWGNRLEEHVTLASRKQAWMGYPVTSQSSRVEKKARPSSTWWWGVSSNHFRKSGKEEKMAVKMRTGDGQMEVRMRISEEQQEEYRVSHMIFADSCYLFATSIEEIRKMITDTTEELRKRGLDWKEDWKLTKESTKLRRLKPFRPWRLWSQKKLIRWVPCDFGLWRLTRLSGLK